MKTRLSHIGAVVAIGTGLTLLTGNIMLAAIAQVLYLLVIFEG